MYKRAIYGLLSAFLAFGLAFTSCNSETKTKHTEEVGTKKSSTTKYNHPKSNLTREIPDYFNMSVMRNINWEESPTFTYKALKLRGEEYKIGILSNFNEILYGQITVNVN
ncbi:hypothetical protein JOC77_003751 [Peribacillus deserti]|uniref:Uncharacterized protein n=1 Tax=Peribacillus deserti TaxID=673318 RepID=A0ABS2QMP3_9BACI|nr:hypothetical protein [Peribacillus deserti]MBM7694290.1 hypothetical protein [Peribacillus deserti]